MRVYIKAFSHISTTKIVFTHLPTFYVIMCLFRIVCSTTKNCFVSIGTNVPKQTYGYFSFFLNLLKIFLWIDWIFLIYDMLTLFLKSFEIGWKKLGEIRKRWKVFGWVSETPWIPLPFRNKTVKRSYRRSFVISIFDNFYIFW